MKNYGVLGGCYPPQENTLLNLHKILIIFIRYIILHKILSLIH